MYKQCLALPHSQKKQAFVTHACVMSILGTHTRYMLHCYHHIFLVSC